MISSYGRRGKGIGFGDRRWCPHCATRSWAHAQAAPRSTPRCIMGTPSGWPATPGRWRHPDRLADTAWHGQNDPHTANRHRRKCCPAPGGLSHEDQASSDRVALALDPELVCLDEPTSGLEPIAAEDFDELITTLQQTLGLTVFMVTHDLDSLHTVCDRIAALADGKVVAQGPMSAMLACQHPWVKSYFRGKRSRAVASVPN
jgi:hypothetical protein